MSFLNEDLHEFFKLDCIYFCLFHFLLEISFSLLRHILK